MAKGQKDFLLSLVRDGREMTFGQQLKLSVLLAVPAILAQVSSVMMQYIDTAMVGRLGAGPSASIGLVTTCSWLFSGFTMAVATGFSVQVAHLCGAKDFAGARRVLRQGLVCTFGISLFFGLLGLGISPVLPRWLGGTAEINPDATAYFWIYSAFIPFGAVGYAANAMLQGSGNMKVPSILYIAMCVLDVILNYVFIYLYGMGVAGAALGTGLSELLTTAVSLWFVLCRSKELKITGEPGSFRPTRAVVSNAAGITGPMWLQNIIMRGAHVMSTLIVAPLGPISIAANAFAITAESFCYMPGYGLEEAATTLVGQSLGARRKDIARHFARITIWMGAIIMSLLAVVLFFFAPQLMALLSTDPDVVTLGARVLRIEAFAETFYAVSIVAYGACVGAGQTKVPTFINFGCMWIIRIGLALLLTPRYGLVGYWIAMGIDLNIRGILFLWYIRGDGWMSKRFSNA